MTLVNSAMQEVQAAIFQTLQADTGLAALVGTRIFDEVPAGLDEESYPYVHIAEASEQPDGDTWTSKNRVVSLKINVWSRAKGWKEAQAVLDELIGVLFVDLFTAPGAFVQPADWTIWRSAYVLAQEIRDPEGTRRMVCTFAFSAERALP
jgi:hypothetical protein